MQLSLSRCVPAVGRPTQAWNGCSMVSTSVVSQRCTKATRQPQRVQLQQARQRTRVAKTVQPEEATAATDDVEAEDTNSRSSTVSQVKEIVQAYQGDDMDTDELVSLLEQAEAEIAQLKEAATSAEARTTVVASALSANKDQLIRLTADFENFRRRTAEQTAQTKDNVRGDVITQLLPLVDAFELARTQVKAETEQEQKINNSYQGLYKQMVDLMRSLGVEPVPTVGTPFDPEIHEAIMREASTEHPDGTVTQEFRRGFRLGDKLMRPAMVKVAFNE